MELQNAINIAMKDTSLAGKKQLAELQKKMEEAKVELTQMEKDKNRQDRHSACQLHKLFVAIPRTSKSSRRCQPGIPSKWNHPQDSCKRRTSCKGRTTPGRT